MKRRKLKAKLAEYMRLQAFLPKYPYGCRVIIDATGEAIKGTVRAFCMSGEGNNVTYEVVWYRDGSRNTSWVDEFDLTAAEKERGSAGFSGERQPAPENGNPDSQKEETE